MEAILNNAYVKAAIDDILNTRNKETIARLKAVKEMQARPDDNDKMLKEKDAEIKRLKCALDVAHKRSKEKLQKEKDIKRALDVATRRITGLEKQIQSYKESRKRVQFQDNTRRERRRQFMIRNQAKHQLHPVQLQFGVVYQYN